MAKITKVNQLLFGSTGASGDFGQFGSMAAGTKVNTKDPATIMALPAFLAGWKDAVTSGETPTLEEMNALFLLAFNQIAYLMQAGISEWDTAATYYIGSLVNVSGTIYKSLTDNNTGNNPTSSTANWVVSAGVPVGVTQDFCGGAANLPAGFLICDGSAVSRTTYANLYAAIGTAWGVGDGSTTFNLPNLKGLVTAGYDSAQTEFNAIGKTGGAKTHTLTTDEMPSHTHSYAVDTNQTAATTPYLPYATKNAWDTSLATNSAGGGQAHNNLQPYGTVLKIIKY